jgi:predicted ATPase
MRVYLSGSHGVGKSTLARYVSNKYSLPMLTEAARMVLSERELQIDTLRYDMDVVDSYQKAVYCRQLDEEAKMDNFVADRCVIDNLAYSATHSRIFRDLFDTSDLLANVEILRKPDSVIFFVRPSEATLHQDGVRERINWDGVVTIDAQIKLLFEIYNIRYFQIDTESMQERVKIIESVLSLIPR